MLKALKNVALRTARALGAFSAIAGSRWRRQRLLILSYHGLSLRDEHEWDGLFVTPAFFRQRLETLARLQYHVAPLADAVAMLGEGNLPPRSVVLTFDDGFHDLHEIGFPLLREFGFPATVYQTTWYADRPFPVFNLVLSYVLWRGASRHLDGAAWEIPRSFDLSSAQDRLRAVDAFRDFARRRQCTAAQKDQLVAQIAGRTRVDYDEILRLRMLQLMTANEIREVAAAGIDVQLHTHRHRTPLDESLFVREIQDNRQWLASSIGTSTNHFCYPSGHYRREFLSWLRVENVISATTCESGIASRGSEPLLLPRVVDSMNVTEVDFEGWLSGFSSLLPHRQT
jgi:peptidoglycan/xylan/chitin deacetylase (PgdA/CDA1 family)